MTDHYVTLDDGTVFPVNVGAVAWTLRYGTPTRSDLLFAASVLSIWAAITDPRLTMRDAETRLRRARAAQRDAPIVDEDGVPVGGGEPQPTTSTDNGLRRHDPNDDDPVTRAGKAAAALRYAVDLPPDMRDLAYEQVKAGLLSVGGGEPQPTTRTDNDAEDEPHYEPPCCCSHVWDEHDIRSSTCEVPGCFCIYFEADESVRSAGGGDQPDTPCPQCGGGPLLACTACTDKAP